MASLRRVVLALLLAACSALAPHNRNAGPALQGPWGRHLGLRGGDGGGGAQEAATRESAPLSLWTSLFTMAFASTLVTAQLATRDLIPGRNVLRYQVVGKHRLPDRARGGNASVLQIVVSTSPLSVAPPCEALKEGDGQELEQDTSAFDVHQMNKGLTLPTEFDLEEGDHMLWYRYTYVCVYVVIYIYIYILLDYTSLLFYTCKITRHWSATLRESSALFVCESVGGQEATQSHSGACVSVSVSVCTYIIYIRLHDIGVQHYVNRAALMALHYHLTYHLTWSGLSASPTSPSSPSSPSSPTSPSSSATLAQRIFRLVLPVS